MRRGLYSYGAFVARQEARRQYEQEQLAQLELQRTIEAQQEEYNRRISAYYQNQKAQLEYYTHLIYSMTQVDTTLTKAEKVQLITRLFDIRKLKNIDVNTIKGKLQLLKKIKDSINGDDGDFFDTEYEYPIIKLEEGHHKGLNLLTLDYGGGEKVYLTAVLNRSNSWWRVTIDEDYEGGPTPSQKTIELRAKQAEGRYCADIPQFNTDSNFKKQVIEYNKSRISLNNNVFKKHATNAAALAICSHDIEVLKSFAECGVEFNNLLVNSYLSAYDTYNPVLLALIPGHHLIAYKKKYALENKGRTNYETANAELLSINIVLDFLQHQGVSFDHEIAKNDGNNVLYMVSQHSELCGMSDSIVDEVLVSLIQHGANPFYSVRRVVDNMLVLRKALQSGDEAVIKRIDTQFQEFMINILTQRFLYRGSTEYIIEFLQKLTGQYDEEYFKEHGKTLYAGGLQESSIAKQARALIDSGIITGKGVIDRAQLIKILSSVADTVVYNTENEGVNHIAVPFSGAGGGINADGVEELAGAHGVVMLGEQEGES